MKKYSFPFLALVILLCFSVTACSDNEKTASDLLIPENITRVELGGGQYYGNPVEPRELSEAEIKDLNTWVSQLSLIHKPFEEGNSPSDAEGGTAYIFSFNGDETSFSWVDTGTEQYILYENEWYEIIDISDAPLGLPS